MAEYYSTDFDKMLKNSKDAYADTKIKGDNAINALHDSKKKTVTDQHDADVKETHVEYDSLYQKNAVQKLINEKQIAERNANLGLTDSGFNKTQQAAAQLSYANQKGVIDLSKQNKLDSLSQNLATSIAQIEESRATSLAEWDKAVNDQAYSNALEQYNANVEANTKIQKAEIDAKAQRDSTSIIRKNILSSDYKGTLENNGIKYSLFLDGSGNKKVRYVDSKNGDMLILDYGQNPYTLDNNLSNYSEDATALAAKKYGVYSDGYYKPKGLCVISSDGTANYFDLTVHGSFYIEFLGRKETVYQSNDGKKWIWNDAGNRYVEYNYNEETDEINIPDWVY